VESTAEVEIRGRKTTVRGILGIRVAALQLLIRLVTSLHYARRNLQTGRNSGTVALVSR